MKINQETAALHPKPKPIIRWPGGKRRLLKHILPLIPEHECYCEPFAGGLAVLLAKPRSPLEIINDLNGDLISLYRSVQYHLPELQRELTHLVSSRQMFKELLAQPGITDIQRAARFYYRHRVSFAGTGHSFAVARTSGGGASFRQRQNHDLLHAARERLDGVVIEHLSYERCLGLYDSPNTFFFLDPPYLNATRTAYPGWTEPDLRRFRAVLDKVKGRWLVTLDDSPFNRELFKGCRFQEITTRNGCVNVARRPKQTFGELIITPP